MKGFTTVTIDSPHLKGRETWPRYKGWVMAMEYVPKKDRISMNSLWQDWARLHPNRKEWPEWLLTWADDRKRLEAVGK